MAQGRRRHLIELAVVAAMACLAIALFVFARGSYGVTLAASVIASCAGVIGISLVFYEIGRGEDEARAQGWRSPYDLPEPEEAHPERPPHPRPPRRRPRALPRRRGHG